MSLLRLSEDKDVRAQNGMAFSPDGTHLAIAYAKTVAVWNIANEGSSLESIPAVGVNTLAFSPDGKRLATGGFDGTFEVWSLAAEDLITQAQQLTAEEQSKIYLAEPCRKSK